MVCTTCMNPIDGAYTSDTGGLKHPWCYEQDHPFVPLSSFEEVVNTSHDPVLSRALLIDQVPEDIGEQILQNFNRLARELWERRCQPL